jgi:hypothetical protein
LRAAHVTCILIHLDFVHRSDLAGCTIRILAVVIRILQYLCADAVVRFGRLRRALNAMFAIAES